MWKRTEPNKSEIATFFLVISLVTLACIFYIQVYTSGPTYTLEFNKVD